MLSEGYTQIIIKAAEIILQSRVDIKKGLLNHFQSFLPKNSEQLQLLKDGSVSQYLNKLLPKEYYQIRQKLLSGQKSKKGTNIQSISILFYLKQQSSGEAIKAEHWSLYLSSKSEGNQSNLTIVANYVTEIIMLLNKLPLFSIYQKDRQLRTKYRLDYKISYESQINSHLFQLRAKNFIQRKNEYFKLIAQISYLPSYKSLKTSLIALQESKRKTSVAFSDYDGDKKVSVYTFYDPILDFTFISSDDEDFHRRGNSQNIEIRLEEGQGQEEFSQEFQLLISNEEEEFLSENKDLLESLINHEKQYIIL